MQDAAHDWITFHRVRFGRIIALAERDLSLPKGATGGRIGVDSPLDKQGFPSQSSDVWSAFAVYPTRSLAEDVLREPPRHFSFMGETEEAWHALLCPTSHRGDVNLHGEVESGTAIRPGPSCDGPVAVLTSAGYVETDPSTLQRFVEFVSRVYAIRRNMEAARGNLKACIVSNLDGRDGFTFTLWQDVESLAQAAYGTGVHQENLVHHRVNPMCDRTSFTRCAVVDSKGTWSGTKPIGL